MQSQRHRTVIPGKLGPKEKIVSNFSFPTRMSGAATKKPCLHCHRSDEPVCPGVGWARGNGPGRKGATHNPGRAVPTVIKRGQRSV
jgi:hypothetical protein